MEEHVLLGLINKYRKQSMVEFVIAFGGVDNKEVRYELNNKSDKSLEELFFFSRYISEKLNK